MSWIRNDKEVHTVQNPLIKKTPSASASLPIIPKLVLSRSTESLNCEKKKKLLMSPRDLLHAHIKKEETVLNGVMIVPAIQGMQLILKTMNSNPVHALDVWKEKLFERVIAKVRKASAALSMTHRSRIIQDKSVKKIVKATLSKSLEFSGILQRIHKAINFFGFGSNYDYLQPFLSCKDPKKFLKKYEALSNENETFSNKQTELSIESKKRTFYQIMGGKKALKILTEAAKVKKRKILKKECFFQADCYLEVTKKTRQLVEKTFVFLEGFDFRSNHGINPIYLIDGRDIRENYRAFWGEDVFPEKCFKFNGKSYPLPQFKKEEKDKPVLFIQWIIEHLQESIEMPSEHSIKKQSELLSNQALPQINRQHFIKIIALCLSESHVGKITEEDCMSRFSHFHDLLEKKLNDSSFCRLLLEHSEYVAYSILDYLDQERNDYSKTAEDLMKFVYPRLFLYDREKKCIPMRAVLTAMTASCAFGKIDTFFREDLCPELCNDAVGAYYLQYFPAKTLTKFTIDIEVDKTFVVKISRIFKACEVTDQKDHIPKMKFEVLWQICGHLESPKYTARLKIIPLARKKSIPFEIQRKILDNFNLELTNSNWKQHVKVH